MKELIIPPIAKEDPDSFELLRVWAANGEQHVSIKSDLNGDEIDFGQMLADLALHGANLYAEKSGKDYKKVKANLIKSFKRQIKNSRRERLGGIMK